MTTRENRVAVLTPPGIGALAVVRITGEACESFLRRHLSKVPLENTARHTTLFDDAGVIDDPVVHVSQGFQFADISLHGGPWIVQRTLELAERSGFRRTEEGCADCDSTSEIEQEIAAALPLVRTELAIRVLLAQREAWGKMMGDRAIDQMEHAISDIALTNLLRVPRVAIVGVANAGKSTLANQLFGSERSITADLPGTTRDWVEEIADVSGLAILLLDTPGVRETSDELEGRAIELSKRELNRVDLIVCVLDGSIPLMGAQNDLLREYPDALVVLNKSDRPCRWRADVRIDVETVATRGEGVGELQNAICVAFGCKAIALDAPRAWTKKQKDRLRATVRAEFNERTT